MNPELAYFLKINVAIALFYAFYRLFFYKDTFFHWRRTVLLCFFATSIFYPLLNFQEWVKAHEPMVVMVDIYADIMLPEFTATPQETTTPWQEIIPSVLNYIYWSGVLLLSVRFILQLLSIVRLYFRCRKQIIQGVRVHILEKENGPFSFFHWIFVYPPSHTESELSEILTHELTHARQYHSADVLFSELMCIFCWFNPFAWLMKREIRGNLEYMADKRVLETGHDYKSYQYHLLGLAHHKAAATLSNSFNVLPLKNRIKMMNKRRTKGIGRTKYLIFLPLAALLLIISNIETVARTTKRIAKEVIESTTAQESIVSTPPAHQVPPPPPPPQNKKTTVKTDQDKKNQTPPPPPPPQDKKKAEIIGGRSSVPVFEVVDEMPSFVGGMSALMGYVSKNVKYPVIAQENGTQGRVVVSFIVNKDGSISDASVVRSVDTYLDKEALRVISDMPKWIPGKHKGEVVRVKYTVPVSFKLSGPPAPELEVKDSILSEVVVTGLALEEKAGAEVSKIVSIPDVMPQFAGGVAGLMQYLGRNIKYPIAAQEAKEEGRVMVQMVIDKEGRATEPRVIKSASPSLDAEAIRIISGMPRWKPGLVNGEPVRVKYTMPIMFRLTSPTPPPGTDKASPETNTPK